MKNAYVQRERESLINRLHAVHKQAHAHVTHETDIMGSSGTICRLSEESKSHVLVFIYSHSLFSSLIIIIIFWTALLKFLNLGVNNVEQLQRMKWKTDKARALVRISGCCSFVLISRSLIILCRTFSFTT